MKKNQEMTTKTCKITYAKNSPLFRLVSILMKGHLSIALPSLWDFVESDLGCTSRIYFDNVTLTSHDMTLTSQSVIAAKQMDINEVYVVVFLKISL